ncbi:MAG: methylenetetrahydrofolate--tRNA-(uracil(54)-C(5))-methyltransferase (FADH(2)-oxidizing) TrmFO [Clostridiales bacterium]|nr:methylenetetrahydrofolate--tRNA-(uracil(54)-C(5))-methyltransferase (FADH(2)-oxidizing) TrmFO [Clostridiales bacterium]
MQKIKVIGGGLAGAEAAYYLATHDVKVELYDIKPKSFTPAHVSEKYAELVCSNSLKSNDVYGNAAGLLKEEMRALNSLVIEAADSTRVPAGNALAVDREKFADFVTKKIKSNPNIECITEEVTDINPDEFTIVATGPLTTDKLSKTIQDMVGGAFSFYDASAPIVDFESIDMEHAFFGDRYDKGNGDHVNCPMNKDEYLAFIDALKTAERAKLHDFENTAVFEGCMPIEIMAARGTDTLRFGPLKPVGLTDPKTGRWAYACLQLRKEDADGKMYNMVGFQTNLTWGEQKKVFSLIPALKNAEFLRYGVMHKNSFINSPKVLNPDFSLKDYEKVFFAGQITGVEGYVESACSGLMAGIYALKKLTEQKITPISENTVTGALIKYITTENKDFQPMNANFGILPPLGQIIRDKAERKRQMAERSLREISVFKKEI